MAWIRELQVPLYSYQIHGVIDVMKEWIAKQPVILERGKM